MHNLPADKTSFVGRRRELAEVKRLLAKARLVTLTGVGGVGKTRIAVRIARGRARALSGGSWLVNLSDVEDPELVVHAVAQALGVPDQSARPRVDGVVEFLRDRQALLVLDTCERQVEACADLADRLLRAAPSLHILCTTREPLRMASEHLMQVPPLDVESDAAELFRVRALAVRPDFQVTPAVAALCRRLDGLPLAIELAAGRLRTLSVDQIADRLDDRFRLLADGAGPVRRHHTLQTAIGWSHQMCSPPERALWARLSVFPGSFDLAAALAVCGATEDTLGALVEKSIVVASREVDPYRFRMLDTIREYGASQLRQPDVLRRRHRDYYASLVREAERAWTGSAQVHWFHRLRQEQANLWAALDYSLAEPAAGQEMAGRLWFFWIACGFLSEGRHYLDRLLALGRRRGRERCLALWACAFVAGTQGDLSCAEALAKECRADASAIGDDRLVAYAYETQGMVESIRGAPDSALSTLEHSLAYHRRLDHLDAGLLRTYSILGVTRAMLGEYDLAVAVARECRALCAARGELWQRSYADFYMALALRGMGDPRAAAAHLTAAIEVKQPFRDVVGLVMCVELLAGTAADLGDGERAARLLAAAQQVWRMFGLPSFGSPFYTDDHRRTTELARSLLGPAAYSAAVGAGAAMSLDDLVAYALDRRPAPARLTRREREVASLVAAGLSNKDIADRLVVTARTVDSHVAHILAKLGFSSRAQIAAWVVENR